MATTANHKTNHGKDSGSETGNHTELQESLVFDDIKYINNTNTASNTTLNVFNNDTILNIIYGDWLESNERTISDISVIDNNSIFAYCHLRNDGRTFKLSKIINVIDIGTGEIIEDVYSFFKLPKPPIEILLNSILIKSLPAIMALKYFTLQVRSKKGFAEKERNKLIDFVQNYCIKHELDKSIIDEWLKKLWVGDIKDNADGTYQNCLNRIPQDLRRATRETVIAIAHGSGRVPISEAILSRIEMEYPEDGSTGVQQPGNIIH